MNHIELIARILLLHNGKLLLDYVPAGDYYYIPGGHVEYGETMTDCLTRELQEENSAAIRVGRRLEIFENFFSDTHSEHHELLVLHEGELLTPVDQLRDNESKIQHRWVALSALSTIRILPEPMHAYVMRKFLGEKPPH